MRPGKIFTKFKQSVGFEMPFFIFATLVLMGIGVWSVVTSPALHAPIRLVPFILLMVPHIVLYWVVGFVFTRFRQIAGYLLLQGALAFVLNLLGENQALVFGLYLAMVGIVIGIFRLTRWGFIFIAFYLGLSLINFGILEGWDRMTGWIIAVVPAAVFVSLYVLLYVRQTEAKERAQALLAELEKANRQLADYAAQVERLTLANERQRMARELHDTLSQGLAGLILQLEAAQAHLDSGRGERAGVIVQQAMDQARSVLADARRAIGDLRQAGAGEHDLEGEIHQEAERFSQATGIPCQVEVILAEPPPPALREPVLRVVSEGLTNVARHARAASCQVSVQRAGDWLEVCIGDDGAGFDPASAGGLVGHYGLLGMHERARLAGGTLEVTSAPGQGTTIRMRLPWLTVTD